MTQPTPEVELLPADTDHGLFTQDDADTLRNIKRLRQTLINELAKDNKLPQEKSDRILLSQLLNDQESAVIAKTRLKVAAKSNEAVTNLTGLIGQALAKHKVEIKPRTDMSTVQLPAEIELTNVVPGEMDIGNLPLKLQDLKDH